MAKGATGIKAKLQFGGTAEILEFEAPQGRPSADGTVAIFDPRYLRTQTTHPLATPGTAARKAISVTTSVAAGHGEDDPTLITITTPAAVRIGDYLWITDTAAGGLRRERFEVAAYTTTTVTSRHPLENAYLSGATVDSAVMTSPVISSSWLADMVNLIEDVYAVWVYTVDGKVYTTRSYANVVRDVVDWSIPDSDLFDRYPDLRRFKPSGQVDFQPQQRAARRDVERFLEGVGVPVDRVRGSEVMKGLVECRWALILAENAAHPNSIEARDFIERRTDEWNLYMNQLTTGIIKVPIDKDHDDVLTPEERQVHRCRILR